MKLMYNLLIADLFCGCGGLTYGIQKAGLSISVGIDNWEAALHNYSFNFHHNCIKEDLTNTTKVVNILTQMGINFIVGGLPCQDFSQA